jgi:hypothetical protein
MSGACADIDYGVAILDGKLTYSLHPKGEQELVVVNLVAKYMDALDWYDSHRHAAHRR